MGHLHLYRTPLSGCKVSVNFRVRLTDDTVKGEDAMAVKGCFDGTEDGVMELGGRILVEGECKRKGPPKGGTDKVR